MIAVGGELPLLLSLLEKSRSVGLEEPDDPTKFGDGEIGQGKGVFDGIIGGVPVWDTVGELNLDALPWLLVTARWATGDCVSGRADDTDGLFEFGGS